MVDIGSVSHTHTTQNSVVRQTYKLQLQFVQMTEIMFNYLETHTFLECIRWKLKVIAQINLIDEFNNINQDDIISKEPRSSFVNLIFIISFSYKTVKNFFRK